MEATSNGKVYYYEFSQPSNAVDIETGEQVGPPGKVAHGGELEYLFGHPYTGATG